MKKIIILLTSLLLAATDLNAQVWSIGVFPDNVTATLSNGTLTISGTGKMRNWRVDAPDGADPIVYNNSEVRRIIIEDGVTHIGNYAFSTCKNLTSVSIGKGVKSIGQSAFIICEALPSIIIPENVTSIGAQAFLGCTNLAVVFFEGNMPTFGSDVFNNENGEPDLTLCYTPEATGW
ncbi:MAG: leucine-rich repeat domain-containing protein, partial [Bacteroidales bacterium]|nr:leucine-rich repeat domain-containing protein [Bacteroidales bacterium]